MNKLWAFGCSHTSGKGLGIDTTNNQKLQKLLQIHNQHSLHWSDERIYKEIKLPWVKLTRGKSSPELSYSGILADTLSLQYMNQSQSGAGMDYSILKLIECLPDIDTEKDVVILGVPSPYRFINLNGQSKQLNTEMLAGNLNKLNEFSPGIDSLEIYWLSMLEYIKIKYSFVKLIKIYDIYHINEHLSTIQFNQYFTNKCLFDFKHKQYPCGHYDEDTHAAFGRFLAERINNE